MHPIFRFLAIASLSTLATTAALKAMAAEGFPHERGAHHAMGAMPPSPLQDLREVLPTLKLSAEQEALLSKAQGAFAQAGAARDYQRRKAMEEFRQGLSANTPLGALARKAAQDREAGLERMQEADKAWIAFLDSLDAGQSSRIRKHLQERMEGFEKARARMGDDFRRDHADCPMPGRPQPR